MCVKRVFLSKRHARLAHKRASWRVRAYWCDEHRGWHVTNEDKR